MNIHARAFLQKYSCMDISAGILPPDQTRRFASTPPPGGGVEGDNRIISDIFPVFKLARPGFAIFSSVHFDTLKQNTALLFSF